LETFREEGIFHEHLATTIRDDFVAALDPLSLDVTANFNSRGGIAISATSSYDAEVAVRDWPAPRSETPHDE
jgi:7-cyano-7-deazaguanine reductase